MLHNKFKIRELLLVFAALIFLVSVSACAVNKSEYKLLPSDTSGKLLIRGYKVSGSMNNFWVLDLATNKIYELFDEDLINLLNLKYMSFSKYNIDDQKVKHHNKLVYSQPEIIFSSDYDQDLFNLIIEPRIKPLINVKDNYLISFNYKYKVFPDYRARKITVNNLKEKKEYSKTFDNNIFGFAFSPDNKYLVFFEHQPFAFSDGSVYEMRFLELASGEIFRIKNGRVSLPGAVIWLKKMP